MRCACFLAEGHTARLRAGEPFHHIQCSRGEWMVGYFCGHAFVALWTKTAGYCSAVVWMRSGNRGREGPENTTTVCTPLLFLAHPLQPAAPASHTQGPWMGSPGTFLTLLSLSFSCLGGARSAETGSCTEAVPLRGWACSPERPRPLRFPVYAFCMSSGGNFLQPG